MLVESTVYRLLSEDDELNNLFDDLREAPFDSSGLIKQGLFTYSVPESFRKEELAPFVRINPIDENPAVFMDDTNAAEDQTVQVDWWCKRADHSKKIKKVIDRILKENRFVQYDSKRYKDPDIDLIMNVRKYRVFDFK